MTKRAPLLRAYAVLERLEALRRETVASPTLSSCEDGSGAPSSPWQVVKTPVERLSFSPISSPVRDAPGVKPTCGISHSRRAPADGHGSVRNARMVVTLNKHERGVTPGSRAVWGNLSVADAVYGTVNSKKLRGARARDCSAKEKLQDRTAAATAENMPHRPTFRVVSKMVIPVDGINGQWQGGGGGGNISTDKMPHSRIPRAFNSQGARRNEAYQSSNLSHYESSVENRDVEDLPLATRPKESVPLHSNSQRESPLLHPEGGQVCSGVSNEQTSSATTGPLRVPRIELNRLPNDARRDVSSRKYCREENTAAVERLRNCTDGDASWVTSVPSANPADHSIEESSESCPLHTSYGGESEDVAYEPISTRVATASVSGHGGERSLLSSLRELTCMNTEQLIEELRSMSGYCNGTTTHCHDWFALTALINSDDAVRHIVVPLLLGELLRETNGRGCDTSAGDKRITDILCALIGLGERAAISLPVLMDMLITSVEHSSLVSLAIRAVGGDHGLRELCRLARQTVGNEKNGNDGDGNRTCMAALQGISVMTMPLVGHTTVYCIGASELENRVTFYQPALHGEQQESSEEDFAWCGVFLKHSTPYTPTHVILDVELARCMLLKLVATHGMERVTFNYVPLSLVVQDLVGVLAIVCEGRELPPVVQTALSHHAIEPTPSNLLPQRTLPFSYDPWYVDRDDELFSVEETLLTVLLHPRCPSKVLERVLATIASLPSFVTIHMAAPVLDFAAFAVARFIQHEQQQHESQHRSGCANNVQQENVIVTAFVAVGRLVRSGMTSPSVTDAACDLFFQCLSSPLCRVRHGACLGLGEMGPLSNKTEAVAHQLLHCLADMEMNHEVVAWSIARLGGCGVRLLLDKIAGQLMPEGSLGCGGYGGMARVKSYEASPLPLVTRVACVRAVRRIDLLATSLGTREEAWRLREEVIQRLGALLAAAGMEENLLIECAYTLGEVLGNNGTEATRRCTGVGSDEAITYYMSEEPSESFEVLKTIIDSTTLPCCVMKALFFALCKFGGGHAEVYASQTVIQNPALLFRVAAAFGLRACGGKVIRTIALALNDDCVEVRLQAFDTLDNIGVSAALAVLQQRPQTHTRQVVTALRNCLLRDMCKNVNRKTAQDLYTALCHAQGASH
ncbi:hypothetical protein TRVL_00550 [Trypanosoma vivax]|nr:hypothetical protein TRVL_00550 [Trypanosoma vivax]